MKNIMFCMATVILLFSMSGAYASDIEEVIVVGAKVSVGNSDPESESNAMEAIDPTRVFQAGGLGGFHAATINGTDTKHTAVYRNGIPVNDVGNGWYDFGTELSQNQIYRIISGGSTTDLSGGNTYGLVFKGGTNAEWGYAGVQFVDSPNTTSQVTYTWYTRSETGVGIYGRHPGSSIGITLMEIAA